MDFDPTPLLPVVTPIVTAAIAYLKNEAARKAGEKAAETLGEKAGEAAAGAGAQALATLRGWFQKKDDQPAQQALELVEKNPDSAGFRQELIDQTARLAATDPTFAQDLRVLAQQVNIAQPGSVVGTVHNTGENKGVQIGVNTGDVTFNPKS